jgi:hypothetical protein
MLILPQNPSYLYTAGQIVQKQSHFVHFKDHVFTLP